MEASIVDLRYRMKDVQRALARGEHVIVLYHGKELAVMKPSSEKKLVFKIKEHPFFGMHNDEKRSVDEIMKGLRKGRCDDL